MMQKWGLPAVVLLLLLTVSCARPIELGSDFFKFSDHFAEAMRWKDFRGAARYLAAAEQEVFLAQFSRNKDLHMVDVRFEQVELNQNTGSAETVLLVEYYLLPSVTVKEWRWTQLWQRTDAAATGGGRWMIQSPPPDFPASEGAD